MLKLYRRVQPGIHPEVEIMAYLTEKAPTVAIPALLGTAEWVPPEGEPTALGLLMAFAPNQGDAWTYTRDHLQRAFQDSLHAPAAAAPAEAKDQGNLHHALYLEIAGQLGRRTAELHRALCPVEESDPAFRPEPIGERDLAAWREAIAGQAETVFASLRDWLAANPGTEGVPELVRTLLGLQPVLRKRVEALQIGRLRAVKTRYHGDLHLGQVLLRENDVVIIDFEGEPRRTMEERRRKHTALKDVAGILRSFDYAAAAAARTVAELPAIQVRDFEVFCTEWRQIAERKFLEQYRAVIAGCPVWPEDPLAAAELLEVLVLDKAVYEIGYELANRPAWLAIPVQAVIDLLTTRPGPAPGAPASGAS